MKSISAGIVVGGRDTVRLDAKGEVDVGGSYGAYGPEGTEKFSEQPVGDYPPETKMSYGLAGRHLPLLGVIAILLFTATYTRGQSTDETRPTPIVSFPITGNLGSGTYYYQMPQSLVVPGTGNATLELTPPDGGGSMTVTFSGPSCCPPEAYIGVTTGLSDPIREAARFNIPRAQPLLFTVYIAAGAKQTVRFRLDFHIVKSGTGGIVVTPPPPTPTPMLTPATPTTCTDLAVTDFSVVEVASGRKVIKGQLLNLSPTAFLAGHSRAQYVAVYDISTAGMEPPLVGHWRFAGVPANGALNFHVEHVFTAPRRTRYEVRIVYLPGVATNRSKADDDCNESNNSTRRQLTEGGSTDDVLTPTTPPTPTATPATPCTDLGVPNFRVVDVTRNRKVIKSVIGNLSATPFKGYPRNQYVAVYDISASAKEPPLVGFFRFTEVPARGTLDFSVEHTLTTPRRTRYEVRLVYLPGTATNRITSDDDCNSENNSTRLQLIEGGGIDVDEYIP